MHDQPCRSPTSSSGTWICPWSYAVNLRKLGTDMIPFCDHFKYILFFAKSFLTLNFSVY